MTTTEWSDFYVPTTEEMPVETSKKSYRRLSQAGLATLMVLIGVGIGELAASPSPKQDNEVPVILQFPDTTPGHDPFQFKPPTERGIPIPNAPQI